MVEQVAPAGREIIRRDDLETGVDETGLRLLQLTHARVHLACSAAFGYVASDRIAASSTLLLRLRANPSRLPNSKGIVTVALVSTLAFQKPLASATSE